MVYFIVASSTDKTSHQIPSKPLLGSLLGDLVQDCEEQRRLGHTEGLTSQAPYNPQGISAFDQRSDLRKASVASGSQTSKIEAIMLSNLNPDPGSSTSKHKDNKEKSRPSLKKLSFNNPQGSSGSAKPVAPNLENGKAFSLHENLGYSFISSTKFKQEIQVNILTNYDQINGEERDDPVESQQQLSISPTKVRKTPVSHVLSSIHSENFRSFRDLAERELTVTGCFSTTRARNALQLKKLNNGAPQQDHNRISLISFDELMVARLPTEVSGTFKYQALLESPLGNLQSEGNLNLGFLKTAIVCGLSCLPIDPSTLSERDSDLYNELFNVLPKACPGFRKSEGVVSVKGFRNHFSSFKQGILKVTKYSLNLLAAVNMGYCFLIDQESFEKVSSKKNKTALFYEKIEIRVTEWFNQSWNTIASFTCEYQADQELSFFFEGEAAVDIVEKPSEMKEVKLQIWASSANRADEPILVSQASFFPSLCVPGYRTLYLSEYASSHLVIHLASSRLQSSS